MYIKREGTVVNCAWRKNLTFQNLTRRKIDQNGKGASFWVFLNDFISMTLTGIAKVTTEFIVIYIVISSTKSTLEQNST